MKKHFFYFLFPFFIIACSSSPKVAESPETSGTLAGFYRVTSLQQFESVHVRSADVFVKYSKIFFEPLSLENLEIDDSRLTRTDTWTLQEDDVENAQRHFVEQLNHIYQQPRNFERVLSADELSLKVEVVLTKYRPNSPRDSITDRSSHTQYFSEGAGRLFMKTKVTDAQSGELLAVIEDDRELGSTWQEDNRVNNLRRFKLGLNTWIVRIDQGLASLQKL